MEITLRDWRIGDENDLINLYDKYDRTYCDFDYPMPGTCDREKANFHITNFPLIRKFGGDVQAIVLDGKIVGLIKYRKLIDHCVLEIILLPEIWAEVQKPDIASARLLEKIGFRLEGEHKNYMLNSGEHTDLLLYGLLKSRYGEIKQQ